MSGISICKARPEHYPAIREMVWQNHQSFYGTQPVPDNDESFFDWAYSDETLNRLENQNETWQGVAISENNEIVGYIVLQKDTRGVAELMRLYVSPLHHRQGIGKKLLDEAIAKVGQNGRVKKVWLVVLRENPIGRAFYKKYGFELERDEGPHPEYGAHESYYVFKVPNNEPALTH